MTSRVFYSFAFDHIEKGSLVGEARGRSQSDICLLGFFDLRSSAVTPGYIPIQMHHKSITSPADTNESGTNGLR